MWAWLRGKTNETPKSGAGHEEISEKRTTKVGYLLLFFMGLFIVIIGQTIFSDIGRIPDKPEGLSSCSQEFALLLDRRWVDEPIMNTDVYATGYDEMTDTYRMDDLAKQQCQFSRYEETSGAAATLRAAYPDLKRYYALEDPINRVERDLNILKPERTLKQETYDISLQERQAGITAPVMNPEQAGSSLKTDTQAVMRLESERKALLSEQAAILDTIGRAASNFETQQQQAKELYLSDYNWYRIKIFLLSLLFILPLFLYSLRRYLSWKREDSPYTIIVGALLGAFSVLLLQVVGMFLYEIIPRRIIQLLIEFFTQFAFLRYVLYYGSVLLVIALFGGIVYYIQKTVFSKEAVALRSLKDRKCPTCSFAIDLSMKHCPKCGHTLQSECANCHGLRFEDLPVCHQCGARRGVV